MSIRRYYIASLGSTYILTLRIDYDSSTGLITMTCFVNIPLGVDAVCQTRIDYTPAGGSATTGSVQVTIAAGDLSGFATIAVAGVTHPIQINPTRDGITSYVPLIYKGDQVVNKSPY